MPTFRHGDADIHYDLHGASGPPVVLLTGWAVGGGVWEYQVPALAPRHRVACLDNRGAGRTRAPTRAWSIRDMAHDVLALFDHLGWQDAHVVGASMGGMIAQEVALAAPARTRSLTLIATHSGRLADHLPRIRTLVGFARVNTGPSVARRKAVERMLFPRTYLDTAPREPIDRAIERDFVVQPPLADRMAQLGAILRHSTARRLRRLTLPTLVVVAGQDDLLPPAGAEALARIIPGARLVRLPDAGHGVIGQCPDEVNAALLDHLAEADRQAPGTSSR
ncbi:MAG: alpha/beta fold hydrolase [Deltaproteobacteria bacterium]|nr:alpha/beta fold hydrolase [Deltaproteobacteria bacterium]